MKKNVFKGLWGEVKHQVVDYWDKPRDNEFMSNKELTHFTLAYSGINLHNFMSTKGFLFVAGALFAGAVMDISAMDFATLALISTVFNYLFLWVAPLNILTYENHGMLNKKTACFAHIAMSIKVIVAIGLYFVPSAPFEGLIRGLPQILANSLLISVFNFYTDWIVRRKFSKKYGRIKPFMIIYGIPIFIVSTLIVYVNPEWEYTKKLIILHGLFNLLGSMTFDFTQQENLTKFLSPNSQERQRLYSYVPIISFALVSILNIVYPIWTKGRLDDISVYRTFVPIFCGLGICLVMFVCGCKEKIFEDTSGDTQKVVFKDAAKNCLKDKYLWIIKLNGVFGVWLWIYGGLMTVLVLYRLNLGYLEGIFATIIALPIFFANLFVPVLTKRFPRRNIIIGVRIAHLTIIALMGLSIVWSNVWLFVLFSSANSFIAVVANGTNQGIIAEVLDHHQYKYGVRCDSSMQVVDWILNPIALVIGYILPLSLKQFGFTSDWDILHNKAINDSYLIIHLVLVGVSIVLSSIPILMYDITPQKHHQIILELQKRVETAKEEPINSSNNEDASASITATITE